MTSRARVVQRNFQLPVEQAEWLRAHSYETRIPQAEIVRQALDEYRHRSQRATTSAPAGERHRRLVERFERGDGVDLDMLGDKRASMWSHDA